MTETFQAITLQTGRRKAAALAKEPPAATARRPRFLKATARAEGLWFRTEYDEA
ncbi:MAG: hypothetical protein R3C49_05195 [Planctomycetaceae bacterium]